MSTNNRVAQPPSAVLTEMDREIARRAKEIERRAKDRRALNGRPHRKFTLEQIAEMQKLRSQGTLAFTLRRRFQISASLLNYYTRGKGRIQRGICRYCFCTETTPCIVGQLAWGGGPAGCSWLDKTQTLCNNPSCCGKALAALKKESA